MDGLLLIPPRFLYCRRRRRVGVRLVRARGDHRRSDTGRREKGMGWAGWAAGERQVRPRPLLFFCFLFIYLTEREKQLIGHPYYLGKIWEGSH
jgi:hypothetical protein